MSKKNLTRHNGRSGKNGTYNPKHNDRRFDVENSEHIDAERAKRNENVHFLNQVDEADLFSLMDEDEAAAIKEQLAAEAAARQQETQPAITPTEPAENPESEQEPQHVQKSKLPYVVGLVVLLGGCAAGGVFFLMKNKKQKAANDHPDPDADYREDDDGYDIPEEADDAEEYDESEED